MRKIFKIKGIFLIPFIFFVFFVIAARPIKIVTDNSKKIFLCWMWDKGEIDFTNSVTGGKVRILFRLIKGFDDYKMITDEKTENYYTSGTYSINSLLKRERERKMFFCSIVGMKIKIGSYKVILKNNCATVEVLWPPKVIF